MRSKTDPTPNPTPQPCAFTARFLAQVRDPATAWAVRRTGELLQTSLEAACSSRRRRP